MSSAETKNGIPGIWLLLFAALLGMQVVLSANQTRLLLGLSRQISQRPSPSAPDDARFSSVPTDHRPRIGRVDAPVQIVVFSDYGCSVCATLDGDLQQLLSAYPDDVAITFRSFPPTHRAAVAARGAFCASAQGKFLPFHRLLFENPKDWKAEEIIDSARSLGMDAAAFKACLSSDSTRAEIDQDRMQGNRLGVKGTPTFFVNGRRVSGWIPYAETERLVREELSSAR